MANHAVTGKSGLTRGAAAYGLGLMTLLNFVNYIDRYVLPAVAPRIKEELSLTDTQLGFLGSAFLFSYFIASPLFGWMGDRLSRTRLMACRRGDLEPGHRRRRPGAELRADGDRAGRGRRRAKPRTPPSRRRSFPTTTRPSGAAASSRSSTWRFPSAAPSGYLLGGLLESHFGWRTAFFAVGLPGLLLALLTLTAPDPPRGINDAPEAPLEQPGSYWQTLGLLARNRDYVMAVLGYAAYTFAVGGMSFWVPIYLNRERAMALDEANYMVGAITVVAGIGGTFLGGYLADLLAPRIRQAHLYVSGVSMVLAIPFAWVAFSSGDRTIAMSALLGAEFMVFLSTGPINVVLVSVVPVAIRATAMAVCIFFIHLFGDAAAPIVIGAVSDRVGLSRAVLIMPVVVARLRESSGSSRPRSPPGAGTDGRPATRDARLSAERAPSSSAPRAPQRSLPTFAGSTPDACPDACAASQRGRRRSAQVADPVRVRRPALVRRPLCASPDLSAKSPTSRSSAPTSLHRCNPAETAL